MFRILLPVYFAVAISIQYDPATMQLAAYRNKTKCPVGILTTLSGAPVEYTEATNSIDSKIDFIDSELMTDIYTNFVRKRIPEREVHAVGASAFGYFVNTHDISHITKAKVFCGIGKKTPIAVRFSMGLQRIGGGDTTRQSRGMAVKWYTEEGIYDVPAFNLPAFLTKDPLLVPPALDAARQNPATNLPDYNMLWDIVTLRPELLNAFIRTFSHVVMPCSYAQMESYGIHTIQFYNESGGSNFGRWYMRPCKGACYLNATAAANIGSGDPDFYARDLYNRIATGNYPCWELKLQIVPQADVEKHQLDVFDPSQELYFDRYPPISVGRLILNENLKNHFAQSEIMAFCPGNNVPGIHDGPDPIFKARRFAYRHAQLYRLGSNFKKIPVNSPLYAQTYNRDGVAPVNDNGGEGPIYFPNSFNGPAPIKDTNRPPLLKIRITGEVRNLKQVKKFVDSLNSKQRTELIQTMIASICPCLTDIKKRVVKLFTGIHSGFGKEVAKALAAKCPY